LFLNGFLIESSPRRAVVAIGDSEGRGLSDQSQVLFNSMLNTFDELFKDANVQGGGRAAFGVELSADGEPVHHFAFDRFDYAIRAFRCDAKARCDFVDRHVVAAADANFAIAIDTPD
jgi:hypothetical protein